MLSRTEATKTIATARREACSVDVCDLMILVLSCFKDVYFSSNILRVEEEIERDFVLASPSQTDGSNNSELFKSNNLKIKCKNNKDKIVIKLSTL